MTIEKFEVSESKMPGTAKEKLADAYEAIRYYRKVNDALTYTVEQQKLEIEALKSQKTELCTALDHLNCLLKDYQDSGIENLKNENRELRSKLQEVEHYADELRQRAKDFYNAYSETFALDTMALACGVMK